MGKKQELKEGELFGTVKYITDLDKSQWKENGKRRTSLFNCGLCGSDFISTIKSIKHGQKSCGCLQRQITIEISTTHGLSRTRQYKTWCHMKERCDNPNAMYYADYGGRGITYCPQWKDFINFWIDMSSGYADNLELDRIDVNLSYCKENCKWSTESAQAYNQRLRSTNTSGRTGVRFCVKASKWTASIQKNGKSMHLGYFFTFEEACIVRSKFEIELYGFTKA